VFLYWTKNNTKDKKKGHISHSNSNSKHMLNIDENGNEIDIASVAPSNTNTTTTKHAHKRGVSGREGIIPVGVRQNPYSNMDIQPVNTSQMSLLQSIKGHDAAISSYVKYNQYNYI